MDSPSNKTKTESPATADSSSHLTLYRGLPEQPMVVAAGYRECRKNHAVRLGRLALDGCREFMPSTSASLDSTRVPAFLVCAACGCHRNFHRRDRQSSPSQAQSPPSTRPLSPVPTSYYAPVPWMLRLPGPALSLSDGKDGDPRLPGTRERRKRERTKFSEEQKEKMEAFAEKVGWKMKLDGGDEEEEEEKKKAVEEFCREVGVSRGVLRIWMNNHKHKHKHKPKPRKVYLVDGDHRS